MSEADNRALERTLMGTDDAMVWAEEFCRIFHGKTIMSTAGVPGEEGDGKFAKYYVDEGGMVTWFANAMQVAVDQYERRKLRTKDVNQATEHVSDSQIEAFVEGADDGRTRPTDLDHRDS